MLQSQVTTKLDSILCQLELNNTIQSVQTSPLLTYEEQATKSKSTNDNAFKPLNLTINTPNTGLNSFKSDPRWETFKSLVRHESAMITATQKKDVKEEISQILSLAETFRSKKYYGEAYQELMCATTNAERLSLMQFDPQLEYLHVKGLFLLSVVLFEVKKEEDAIEYLDAAVDRAEALVRSISPNNILLNTQSSLVYTAKTLLCETLLFKAKHSSSSKPDEKESSKVLTSYLLPALRNLLIDQETHVTLLNFVVFRQVILQTSKCLSVMKEYMLARRLLTFGINTFEESSRNNNTLQSELVAINQLIEKQKQPAPAPLSRITVKTSSSFKDDDFDEGWPSSDDDDDNQKEQVPKEKIDLSKFKDDDDESSGWGSELGSPRPVASAFKDLLTPLVGEETELNDPIQDELFPLQYRFFKSRTTDLDVTIHQQTNKPPVLYSLKMNENEERIAFDGKKEMKMYLQTLISKHDLHSISQKIKEGSEESIMEKFYHELDYIDKFSTLWAQRYYETVWRLYYTNTTEAHNKCNKLLIDYFTQLPSARITADVDHEDAMKQIALFRISIALLEIAALMWAPEDHLIFKSMTQNVNKFYPKYGDAILLVEMKAMCHNIRALLYSDSWELHKQIAPTLIGIFNVHNKVAIKIPTIDKIHGKNRMYCMPTSQEIACEALLVLHHFLCNLSPLTLSSLFPDNMSGDYFDENTPNSQTATNFSNAAVNNNQNNGSNTASSTTSTMSWNQQVGLGYPEFDLEIQQHPLYHNIHHRIELLNVLYHKLPCLSPLKASTALSLGQYSRIVSKDKYQAENVLFESVFIFDRTQPIVDSIPALMCDVGTKACIEFALVLTENNKYPFAALAYRASVDNNKLVHMEHDTNLISELAGLSSKNDDWRSAVYYYQELLDRAYAENNVPKVVYLSEKLSEEYMDRGDFRNAEQYVTRAATFVKSNSNNKTGDFELTLHLKLAHLFLQGYYFERGIDLLAKMMEEKLSQIQKICVFTNLAEAYLKKRWLKECDFVLNKLGPLLEHHIIREANVVDDIKVLDIAARCYYRSGHYAYALYSVNIALNRCTTPSRLAQLFLLKGKILQLLSKSCTPINLPTNLHVENVTKHAVFCQFLDPSLFPHHHSVGFVQYQQYLQSMPSSPVMTSSSSSTTSMQQNGYFMGGSPVTSSSPSFASSFLKNVRSASPAVAPSMPSASPHNRNPSLSNNNSSSTSAHNNQEVKIDDILYSKRNEYTNPGQLLQDCLTCYEQSLYYYGAVSDEISVAKVRLRMARTQLDYLLAPIAMLKIDPEVMINIPPPVTGQHVDNDTILDVQHVDQTYITPAMDTAVRTTHMLLSIDAYMTRAEARYLLGRKTSSQAYWTECRDVFFTLFVIDGEVVVSRGGPPGFLERLLFMLGRLVRLLFCFDAHFINRNLAVIDAYLTLQIEIDQVLKRSGDNVEAKDFYSYDSGNDSSGEEAADNNNNASSNLDNPLISQNRIYESMPYNSSLTKGKSLPFLRRARRNSLARNSSAWRNKKRIVVTNGSASQSSNGSIKSVASSDSLIDANGGITVRVTERVWSCFFRMKQHSRKYSQQSMDENDLCHRNQQNMKRLHHLMTCLRANSSATQAAAAAAAAGASTSSVNNNNAAPASPHHANTTPAVHSKSPVQGTNTIHHNHRVRSHDLSLLNFTLDTSTTSTEHKNHLDDSTDDSDPTPRRNQMVDLMDDNEADRQSNSLNGDLLLVNCMMRTLGNSTTDNSDDLLTTSTTTAAVDATSPLQHQMDENSPTNTTAAHYMNENRHSFINMLRHKRKDSLPVDTTCLDALSNIDVKLMSRLVYILQMDDVMIYYTPKPGRKEFHRFGGRSQIFYKPGRNNDHSLSTSPVSPTTDKSFSEPNLHSMTSNSTNHSSIGNLINLRISNNNQMLQANRNVDWLMNDFENFIHAMMMQGKREKRSSGGLEQTLEMITLLRDSMFKGPWTHQPVISKNHQQQTQQQQSPPPIDYRSIYGNALGEIPSTSANNSMIALKKKKSSLVGRSPFRSQTLQPNSTATTTMLRNTSTDLINIIPSLNDLNMPQKPLVCICSRHLQVIPWELMFDAFATRSFTLKDMLQRRTTIRAAQKERYMPTYFCFYSEDEQKFIAPVERQRKDWLFQEFRRHAHLSAQDSAIFHDMLPNLPLHTPLVTYGKKTKSYKNRYKHVNFIKLSQIADKPTQIITHIESFLTSPQYPVFLFTLADLMDLSEAILCVLSYRPDCTLLFIAEGAMVTAVEMLMDMQNMYERNKQLSGNCTSRQGYQFLAHCIHVMRKQLGIPIVVINPPSC